MNDVLFRQVTLYDGTGTPGRLCDVSVRGGKIASVEDHIEERHALTVDGKGLSLAPGFIDVHSHSDRALRNDPLRDCKLRQGITTEIDGQCGGSCGPVFQPIDPTYKRHMQTVYSEGFSFYSTYGALLRDVEACRPADHHMVFVGHNALRGSVIGLEVRPAAPKELDAMKELLEGAMQEGAPGYSTGLVYPPGQYADTKELIELAKVVAKYDGIYTSHIRGESGHLLESVKEAVRIAEEAGVRVNISHFKVMLEKNRPLLKQAIALIEKAVSEGCDITFDVYPYNASSAGMLSSLPPSYQSHGIDWLLNELSTPEGIARLEDAIFHPTEQWENILLNAGFDKFVLTRARTTQDVIGMNYHEIAKAKGISDTAAFAWVIVANRGSATDVRFLMSEDDVATLYAHPLCMVGSDGLYTGLGERSHPRAWGTMTRYLGRFVRERKVLPFEEGIRRITGMPADRYRLKNKGYVRPGYDADLVLFDAERILDHAVYTDPFRPNEGIEMVFVSGEAAVVRDQMTGVRNGAVLRYGK